jgi:short-subunit dehydrogenase
LSADRGADLRGKVILITGASSGIGLEASVGLARMGASLVMVGRDASRTARAVAEVRDRSGAGEVESLLCDLASQRQVRVLALAARLWKESARLVGLDAPGPRTS